MRIICYMIWMKINLLLASANSIARHRKRVYMDDGSSWSVLRGVTTGGVWGVSHPPNLSKWYSRRAKTKKRSGKTTENLDE